MSKPQSRSFGDLNPAEHEVSKKVQFTSIKISNSYVDYEIGCTLEGLNLGFSENRKLFLCP